MGERKTFVLKPLPGRGLFTAWSRFSMDSFADSFSRFLSTTIRDNSWQGTRLTNAVGPVTGTGPAWLVHFYNSLDPTSNTSLMVTDLLYLRGGSLGLPVSGVAKLYRVDLNSTLTGVVMTFGGSDVESEPPHEWIAVNVKNRCFIGGATMRNPTYPFIVTRFPSFSVYRWGQDGPSADLSYTAFVSQATQTNTKQFYEATGITTTAASTAITSSADFDNSGAWDGKTIIINDDPDNETYKINTITTNSAGTLASNAATTFANVPFLVNYGNLSWDDITPKYAYAYYDPETGHITNIGPILTVSEQNMSNVQMELTNIVCTGDTRFTKIVLFRSEVVGGGGVLYPLKLDPAHGGTASVDADGFIDNTPAGTVTYQDNAPDSQLGQILGRVSAPEFNDPPPEDIRYFTYWDGRFWCSTVSEPWRVRYSRTTTPRLLGVGEECFPPDQFIDVTSDDGQVTGFHVVGTTLTIETDKFIYYVDGAEGDYRMVRLSARGAGVLHWAMDDHPGDSSTEAASMVYVGRDKRLYQHFPGGRIVDIGAPIQDKLDEVVTRNVRRPFHVKVLQVEKSWMLALGLHQLSSTTSLGYETYFYDFETQAWHDLSFGDGGTQTSWMGANIANPAVFTNGTIGGVAVPVGLDGGIHHWILGGSGVAGTNGLSFDTQHLDFSNITAKKQLEGIFLYASTDTGSPNVSVAFDGSTSYTALSALQTFTGTPRSRGAGVLYYDCRQISVRQFHTVSLRVGINSTTPVTRLFKIEVFYRVESTGVSGTPSG